MTDSPIFDEQLALNQYWKDIGGLVFLPGTNRAADRFARASFLLSAIPKHVTLIYKGRSSTVLRLSSCGQCAQRATSRERATRDYHSRPTQYFLHDLADGF